MQTTDDEQETTLRYFSDKKVQQNSDDGSHAEVDIESNNILRHSEDDEA